MSTIPQALAITNFLLASGQPVADGEVTIRLNKDCMSPTGQVSTRAVTFELDSNGAPVGGPTFWANTVLEPPDSSYWLYVRDAQGALIMGPTGLIVGPGGGGQPVGFGQSFGQSFGS